MSDEIANFEQANIRRIWDEETEQNYFAVVDVVTALLDSADPGQYWRRMKQREKELGTICTKFPLKNPKNNRTYQTDCANTEGMLRIIQSIPSPKAEPFKQWLARTGRERLEEIQNPELAIERMRQTYLAKGYPEDWIEKRLQSIGIRNELTDEWEQRGVEGREYGILTAEISKGTFELTPGQHKAIKGLEKENLRDHMSNLELIFTMLGEASTTEIARKEDAQGFYPNRGAAHAGGKIAGDARKALEAETGKPVVSQENFLPENQERKQLTEDDGDDLPF